MRDLEEQGLVRRRVLGPPSGARVYELTDAAGALQGIVFGGAQLPADAVTGDRRPAERFVRLFPRPEPLASARR